MSRTGARVWLLVLAGALVSAGGLMHAHVPPDVDGQAAVVAESPRWVPAHALLTLGQAAAAFGVAAGALRLHAAARGSALFALGAALVVVGFAVGAAGTLAAATTLTDAAASGDAAAFAAANLATLRVGWACLALVGPGAALVGVQLARGGSRAVGVPLAVLGGLLVVTALAVPPPHPWLHPFALRWGAVAAGPTLWAVAWAVHRAPRAEKDRARNEKARAPNRAA